MSDSIYRYTILAWIALTAGMAIYSAATNPRVWTLMHVLNLASFTYTYLSLHSRKRKRKTT